MELLLLETKRLFKIEKEKVTIGRSPDCDFFLPGKSVSRVHATLVCSPELGCIINDGDVDTDKYSANGIKINGGALQGGESKLLKHGDEIFIAPGYTLKFLSPPLSKEDNEGTIS